MNRARKFFFRRLLFRHGLLLKVCPPSQYFVPTKRRHFDHVASPSSSSPLCVTATSPVQVYPPETAHVIGASKSQQHKRQQPAAQARHATWAAAALLPVGRYARSALWRFFIKRSVAGEERSDIACHGTSTTLPLRLQPWTSCPEFRFAFLFWCMSRVSAQQLAYIGEPRAACRVELGPGQGHRLNVAKEPTPGRVIDSSFHAIEDGVGLSSDGIALARPSLVARNIMC